MKDYNKDYNSNEKLYRDLQTANLNESTQETKKQPANLTSKKLSNEASHKKELSELEHKYKVIEKNYSKLLKKNTDTVEELKELKNLNDSLAKDLSVAQKTIEKINFEKNSLSTLNEENKTYIRKLESRLVQGAKNQYLIEINNNLRGEMESTKKELEAKAAEVDKFKNSFDKKNHEIKILNKALELKLEEIRLKEGGNITTSLLYNVGQCKQEVDEAKEKYDFIKKELDKNKLEIEGMNTTILELNFSKEHLTELLIEAENKAHNTSVECDSYKQHCTDITEERKMLKEYIDKLTTEAKLKNDEYIKVTKDYKGKLQELKENYTKSEENNLKLSSELDMLKDQNEEMIEKINNYDEELKIKNIDLINLEEETNGDKTIIKKLEEEKSKLEELVSDYDDKLNSNSKTISHLENENLELLKKNKNFLVTQENFQNDIVKQNQVNKLLKLIYLLKLYSLCIYLIYFLIRSYNNPNESSQTNL